MTALTTRLEQAEASNANLGTVSAALMEERRQSVDVMKKIPEALEKLAASSQKAVGGSLMDSKGLGKPMTIGDEDPDSKFRVWAVRVEDFVSSSSGEKFRSAMQWAPEREESILINGLWHNGREHC